MKPIIQALLRYYLRSSAHRTEVRRLIDEMGLKRRKRNSPESNASPESLFDGTVEGSRTKTGDVQVGQEMNTAQAEYLAAQHHPELLS